MAKPSQSPLLRLLTSIFAILFIAFGTNAILNPISALSFFNYEYPSNDAAKKIIDGLLVVYGIRDVAMGLMTFAAMYYGHMKILGWIVVVASLVAVGDGYVCWVQRTGGEWSHWGYAPVANLVGLLLLGVFDGN